MGLVLVLCGTGALPFHERLLQMQKESYARIKMYPPDPLLQVSFWVGWVGFVAIGGLMIGDAFI